MVRKENREVYITFDNKVFLEESEALIYEDKLTVTRYLIEYIEAGETKHGILELNYANGKGYAYANDYCYERFGKRLFFINSTDETPSIYWEIVKELSYEEFSLFKWTCEILDTKTVSLCPIGPYPYWLFNDTKK